MSFTFSQLDAFEICPKKYYEYNVARSVVDADRSNLDWGTEVHNSVKEYLKNNVPLLGPKAPFVTWVDKARTGPGEALIEQKMAIDRNLNPVPYNSKDWWYRGIVDYSRIGKLAAFAADWKTGKKKNNPTSQLALMALLLFQHYPTLQAIKTWYVWLEADDITEQMYYRTDMQQLMMEIIPRVDALEWAFKTQTFPPKRGFLCKQWCAVRSCPFNGKGPRD